MLRYGIPVGRAFLRRESGDRAVVALEADFSGRERDGNLVLQDDVRFLVSAHDLMLDPDQDEDELVIVSDDSVETAYRIVSEPKRTAPGGFNVFWQLHCRGK